MRISTTKSFHSHVPFVIALFLLLFAPAPAMSQEYKALEGVQELKTVFDYGHASPEAALVIFPAVRGVYQSESVTSLPHDPKAVIVFHDAAVKFLSTERKGSKEENETLDKVAEMIRQIKKDGVRMEVCMYAVKVFGVNPDSIMPEIEKVENGWISVAGYQAQDYSLVAIPE